MRLIRGSSLIGYTDLLREFGVDPRPVLAQAHLRPECVGDPDSFIDIRSVIAGLELAAEAAAAPDFGRRLGRRQGLDALGPVGVAARTAATVGDALAAIQHYMCVYSPTMAISVDPRTGHRNARFQWCLTMDRPPPHSQGAELAIGTTVRVFQLLAGPDFRPVEVAFRHQALDTVDNYTTYFGCPVRFNTLETGFTFPNSVLSRPLGSDSAVHDLVRSHLNAIGIPGGSRLPDTIRLLIAKLLPSGALGVDLVASHLAVHPRTLQRNLAVFGATFADLLDEVRQVEADRYIRDADLPLGQLSGLLGYSDQSVLTRSFHRWFGETPSARRRRLVLSPDETRSTT